MIYVVTLRLNVEAETDQDAMEHIQTALTSISHPNLDGHLVDILEVSVPRKIIVH